MVATSFRRTRAPLVSRLVLLYGAARARVDATYRARSTVASVVPMQEARWSTVARVAAESSTPAGLDDVHHWLLARHATAMRIDVEEVPALGQHSWLRLALPITAPRAVLCTLWLVDDVVAGQCLLAGHLRFVAHPNSSDTRLSFSGRTAVAMRSGALRGRADHAARQMLEVIGRSIERPRMLSFAPRAAIA